MGRPAPDPAPTKLTTSLSSWQAAPGDMVSRVEGVSVNDTALGSRFGPYRLRHLLSSDRTGEAYQAEDTRSGRLSAVKLISAECAGDPAFRRRLAADVEAVGLLTEPHVVPVLAHGEIAGRLYVETRLIDGHDLAGLLAAGPLSPPRAVAIVSQVAAALQAAHHAGLVHGDVAPSNIVVTDDDVAYLAGFVAGDGDGAGTGADAAGDVVALSGVLAGCLTGRPVALPPAPPYPQPSKLWPGRVPATLDEVIARGLAGKADDHYDSAAEFAMAAVTALTRPEQHQVSRILRRSEHGTDLAGGAAVEIAVEATPQTRPMIGMPSAPGGSGRAEPPPAVAPATPTAIPPASRWPRGNGMWRRWVTRKPMLIGAAVVVAGAIVAGAGHLAGESSQASPVATRPQIVLPFDGQSYRISPNGVSVDGDGNVYVSSAGLRGKVVKLPAGAGGPTVLPFSDLYHPRGVAVGAGGAVYFTDADGGVVKVTPEATTQTVLAFAGLVNPDGVAVDPAGNVYVADRGSSLVVKLDVGSNTQSVLPFSGLNNPSGVAVDSAGNVYVSDSDNNRVLRLANGSDEQTVLPLTGIASPRGIAVDDTGNVYVTERDRNRVIKLTAGAAIPLVLPFTGLNAPLAVAVDKHGNVYVADRGNDRVVKVPPRR